MAALFEVRRGVGATVGYYGYIQRGALAIIMATDNAGSTTLHYAALCTRPRSSHVAHKLLLFVAVVSPRTRAGVPLERSRKVLGIKRLLRCCVCGKRINEHEEGYCVANICRVIDAFSQLCFGL